MVPKETDASETLPPEEEAGDSIPLEELTALLPPAPLPPGGLSRLIRSLEDPPLRYAPFFGRLAALWDLPEALVIATLERVRDEAGWERTLLPGVRRIRVTPGPALPDADAYLLRFAPGAHFPAHRHAGPEVVFVLEGSYTDDADRSFGPGDQQVLDVNTEHTLHIAPDGPCVAAVVSRGAEFTGWFLGSLEKLRPKR